MLCLKISHPSQHKLLTIVAHFLLPDAFASGEAEARALRGEPRLSLIRVPEDTSLVLEGQPLSVPGPSDCAHHAGLSPLGRMLSGG